MTDPKLILELLKNKSKRINLAFNPKLWSLFKTACLKDGQSPTSKLEDLILNFVHSKGLLTEESQSQTKDIT